MILGKDGNHVSVFQLDGKKSPQSTHIVNTSLAYIHALMSSRNKEEIKEDVCAKFDFKQLKEAREILFRTSAPNEHYGYNGPRGNERDKVRDAFEGIYTKLMKLDADEKMPSFSVSSDELLSLLQMSVVDHSPCEAKFVQVKEDMDELRKSLHSFVSIVTSNNNPPASGIPPAQRVRLLSTGSTTKRSSDEMSEDEEETEATGNDGFQFPRDQRRRNVKKAKYNHTKSEEVKQGYADAAKSKAKPKPPSTWGTAKETNNFRGAVSDIFMYHCDQGVTGDIIKEYFTENGVNVKSIEKKSNALAIHTSFRLSPATKEDYEKIMSADLLPVEVAVRRYIPARWNPNDNKNTRNGRNQFQSADARNKYRDAEAELNQLVDSEVREPTAIVIDTTINNGSD